jgi:putative ABC transport system substrate-binding protein
MEQPALRIRIEKTMFEAANHREIDGASENGSTSLVDLSGDRMRRREFIGSLIGTAVAWPLTASVQQPAMPVVGFLNGSSPDWSTYEVRGFHKGLSENGYVEGQNVAIEYRWAEGHYDRLPALAADLVRRQVTVIATGTTPAALAAKAATTTIPIVFEAGADPVEVGLVASLSRPGGNITGVTNLSMATVSKALEVMHELLPTATIMALLINPTNPRLMDRVTREVQAAARILGLQLHVLSASTEHDIETVFSTLVQLHAGGLVIGPDRFLESQTDIAALALRHALPTIYIGNQYAAAAGGLMSYGSSLRDAYRLAGNYASRILKGANPADLPVVQSAKIDLIINLKTAKTLGLTVPQILLAGADEVIE